MRCVELCEEDTTSPVFGWSFEGAPRMNFTPIFSKYRDRKLAKSYSLVGNDIYTDTTARGFFVMALLQVCYDMILIAEDVSLSGSLETAQEFTGMIWLVWTIVALS